MNFKTILFEKKEGIAKITMNRTKALNAINVDMLLELKAALTDARDDNNVRLMIITGAGERAFAAGADVMEIKNATTLKAREFAQLGKQVIEMIENFEKPVIAAVNGFALGGGCELAMACDFVVASENALFGQPEIKLGIIPGWGGTQRLARLVGWKRAKRLILTGDTIDAKEAERMGLVDKVVPVGMLDQAVNEIVDKLLSKSPLTLKLAKSVLNHGMKTNLEAGLLYETEVFGVCFSTEDQKEGIKAFLEKRKPQFKGK